MTFLTKKKSKTYHTFNIINPKTKDFTFAYQEIFFDLICPLRSENTLRIKLIFFLNENIKLALKMKFQINQIHIQRNNNKYFKTKINNEKAAFLGF